MTDPHKQNLAAAGGALLASSATLVCCVLPAVLVSLGAGAAVVGLVAAYPQLVWLSERKGLVFLTAGLLIVVSGHMVWRGRRLPCPAEPAAARACSRIRRITAGLFTTALAIYVLGVGFAFLL
jgi:hypothetical protein